MVLGHHHFKKPPYSVRIHIYVYTSWFTQNKPVIRYNIVWIPISIGGKNGWRNKLKYLEVWLYNQFSISLQQYSNKNEKVAGDRPQPEYSIFPSSKKMTCSVCTHHSSMGKRGGIHKFGYPQVTMGFQHYWLVVYLPLLKLWKSIGLMTGPTEWKTHNSCSKPPTGPIMYPIYYVSHSYPMNILLISH